MGSIQKLKDKLEQHTFLSLSSGDEHPRASLWLTPQSVVRAKSRYGDQWTFAPAIITIKIWWEPDLWKEI